MPALKVFVSSTCFDFDSIREGLRSFIIGLGHEPVLSEYGDILYDPRSSTSASCIADVKKSDMLVLLIGGRFGTDAVSEASSMIDFEALKEKIRTGAIIDNEKLSVTHLEVLKAIEAGIPVYTFIKEDVFHDYKVYKNNRDVQIKFPSMEDPRNAKYIFEFINILQLRKEGNNIFTFQKEADIERILKKQWSSLFQKLVSERSTGVEEASIRKLEELVKELINTLVSGTPREKAAPAPPKKKHKKILWVDDRPAGNKTVMDYYKGHGILFDTALTTAQGISLFKENLYDLVITDMHRWDDDAAGVKLIEELQHLNCQVPVIVFSSRASIQKHIDEIRRLGDYTVTNKALDVISIIADTYGLSN